MSSNGIGPSPKKSVSTSDKIAPSEKAERIIGTSDDIEYPVVTIRRKYFNNKTGR